MADDHGPKGKVQMLPGQSMTAPVVLSMLLDQSDEIDEMVAVVHWKNGTVGLALSEMEITSLCALHRILGLEIDRRLQRGG